MGAILPLRISLVHQFEIRLIDEGSRLQRVAGSFATEVIAGETAQFVVDERHQFLERRLVALTPVD